MRLLLERHSPAGKHYPLAHYFNEAGYDTAYVGKWHLASDRLPGIGTHCEATPVPKEKQGEYRYWRAADVLEFTSHGYDGYIFDGDGNKLNFTGYRADCINDFAWNTWRADGSRQTLLPIYQPAGAHHQTTIIITRL